MELPVVPTIQLWFLTEIGARRLLFRCTESSLLKERKLPEELKIVATAVISHLKKPHTFQLC